MCLESAFESCRWYFLTLPLMVGDLKAIFNLRIAEGEYPTQTLAEQPKGSRTREKKRDHAQARAVCKLVLHYLPALQFKPEELRMFPKALLAEVLQAFDHQERPPGYGAQLEREQLPTSQMPRLPGWFGRESRFFQLEKKPTPCNRMA
jgi:hypothetical protein